MRAYKNKSQLLIIFLVVGFFIGIIYENIVSSKMLVAVELFSLSSLQQYLKTDMDAEKYLWYVVKARVLILAIVCVFGSIKWKKVFVGLFLGTAGFFAGVMTVTAMLKLGLKGILICVAGIFPQGLFYGMVYWILLSYWYYFPAKQWNRTKLLFVLIMFLVGIILETYVNPIILRMVIKLL